MKWLLATLLLVSGCSTTPATDGGTDAPGEAQVDVCDIDAFFASGGDGKPCARPSANLCFQTMRCPMTYCKCNATGDGPRWKCMTDPNCFPEAGSDAEEDAPTMDAPSDVTTDAGTD